VPMPMRSPASASAIPSKSGRRHRRHSGQGARGRQFSGPPIREFRKCTEMTQMRRSRAASADQRNRRPKAWADRCLSGTRATRARRLFRWLVGRIIPTSPELRESRLGSLTWVASLWTRWTTYPPKTPASNRASAGGLGTRVRRALRYPPVANDRI